MQYIYFGAIFTATIIFFLIGLLLFSQRKRGERSRTILAYMTLISVFNYIGMIIYFYVDPFYNTESIMSVPFLLIGIFVITIYAMYPMEVISPGWLNRKRLIKIYMPTIGLLLFYRLTLLLGVEYTSYLTLAEILKDIGSFQVIFRIVLAMLIFLPAVLLYYMPYTSRYNNTNHKWMRGYVTAVMINMVAYLYVNVNDTFLTCSLYVTVSVLCSMYITYQELFVRLIRNPLCSQTSNKGPTEQLDKPKHTIESISKPNVTISADSRRNLLFERLEEYMNSQQAWRNPDLSAKELIRELYTNRNSLREAMQQNGYRSYTSYVNSKRIGDFIHTIEQQEGGFNYLRSFFDVGFRSKTTAFRNFKDITGMIPSDYFQSKTKNKK